MPSNADAQTGPAMSGRLCLVNDLRKPLTCGATSALGGIVVEHLESGAFTTSSANGSFSLDAPSGNSATLVIAAGDDGYRDLLAPVVLSEGQALNLRLPAIQDATWQSLLTDVGVAETEGTASIAAYLRSGNQAIADLEVIPPSGTFNAPLYDGPLGPNDWRSGGLTGDNGAAILLGVPSDIPTVDFVVSADAGLQDVIGVPVADGFLSFVTVAVN